MSYTTSKIVGDPITSPLTCIVVMSYTTFKFLGEPIASAVTNAVRGTVSPTIQQYA